MKAYIIPHIPPEIRSIGWITERITKESEDYRKGHYAGGTIDWNEAILIKALPYHWVKKGGKKLENVLKELKDRNIVSKHQRKVVNTKKGRFL